MNKPKQSPVIRLRAQVQAEARALTPAQVRRVQVYADFLRWRKRRSARAGRLP